MWSIPILKEFQAMKRTNIYLSEVQAKKLKAIGKKLGLGVSEIIRRMIDEGLKEYESKGRK
jgi:predicted DNA-binding protein